MFRQLLPIVALVALISAHAQPASAQASSRGAAKAAVGMVNLNTASAAEFEGLPGIGAKTAARIIEYRQKNGPFKKVEELMNVRGIGEKNFLKLKPQITVASAKAEASSAKQN
jgi:competence protein ComEA